MHDVFRCVGERTACDQGYQHWGARPQPAAVTLTANSILGIMRTTCSVCTTSYDAASGWTFLPR